MKKIILVLSLVLSQSAFAVTGDNFEYLGYMRTGVGSNFAGGDANNYHQSNVPGNEFRLTNEGAIYGENLLRAYTNGAKSDKGEFFRSNFGFSYNPDGKSQGETPNFYVFSAFIEAGRLDDTPATFWVGKRFYRDSDLHIDDFFYFADTSGSGAGVEKIPVGSGDLAVALMFEDSVNKEVINNVPTNNPIVTDNGKPRTILLDVRLFDIKLDEKDRLNFWGGLATGTGGLDPVTGVNYNTAYGYVAGVKHIHDLSEGYQKFSVIYGHGLMQGQNLGGTFGADPTQTLGQSYFAGSSRLRIVEDAMWQPTAKFAVALGAVYESWKISNQNLNNGRWLSIGARPIYFMTPHYSFFLDAGASTVRQYGDANSRPMYRISVGPQISPKPEFYARPVLRGYISRSIVQGCSVNGCNKAGIPDNGALTATSFGFQGEVWF